MRITTQSAVIIKISCAQAGGGPEAGEGAAEGGERAASPNGFGREGRGLCAMDAAAVRERGGELAYELFAVLIHSVSPTIHNVSTLAL